MDFFLVKKAVGALMMPLPLCMLLLVLCLLAILQQRRTLGLFFCTSSILLFIGISTPFLPDRLLRATEHAYPKFDLSQRVNKIVILGCGHVNDPHLPITSQLYPCSIARINEALRIHQQHPNTLLITSGGTLHNTISNAQMNKRLLLALGVKEQKILSIESSRDTEDEASNLAPYLQGEKFVLVTSASHMLRAMSLFEAQGLQPIAAPTDHLVRGRIDNPWQYILPYSKNISKMERWWYEVLGRTWLQLKALLT